MTGHERDPVRALLQGRCDVDEARRGLACQRQADTRAAVASVKTGARGQDCKPRTNDEGNRGQQRLFDRKEKRQHAL